MVLSFSEVEDVKKHQLLIAGMESFIDAATIKESSWSWERNAGKVLVAGAWLGSGDGRDEGSEKLLCWES